MRKKHRSVKLKSIVLMFKMNAMISVARTGVVFFGHSKTSCKDIN